MINNITLVGRLTAEPELRYTQSGIACCTFTLAVDRSYKNADGSRSADFIHICVWRKLGELCANYLAKGKLCGVQGRLEVRSYEDKTGTRRTASQVVAEDVCFLSPKDKDAGGDRVPIDNPPAWGQEDEPVMEDEDLPF